MISNGEAFQLTYLNSAGKVQVGKGPSIIGGVAFVGTATGQIQFFAGATCSSALTPMISFCATTSAVAGGFSPMFLRMPAVVSGTAGFCVDLGSTNDPNILLFWCPVAGN